MVITGGGEGIMGAAQRGAGRDNSFGLNIRLPFEQEPNIEIAGDRKLINFKYFFTRKLCFIKESSAIVLFPGGFGTHDEGFEALTLMQTGKSQPKPLASSTARAAITGRRGGGSSRTNSSTRRWSARKTSPCSRSPTTSRKPARKSRSSIAIITRSAT